MPSLKPRDDVVIISTSAPADREGYRSDLLKNISYPNGTTGRFIYRMRWIELPDGTTLKSYLNRQAILMFCDELEVDGSISTSSGDWISNQTTHKPGFRFVPLRYAKITRVQAIDETKKRLSNDDYVAITFTLGDFVSFEKDVWQKWVQIQDDKYPRPRNQDVPNTRFVFRGRDFATLKPIKGDDAWRSISTDDGIKAILQNSELFRISGIYKGFKGETPVVITQREGRSAIEMEAGQIYRIRIQIPLKSADLSSYSLAANFSSKSLSPTRPMLKNIGDNLYVDIIINTTRVYLPELATLVIEDPDKKTKLISGPAPEVLVILRPPWWVPWLVLVLVAGALFTNISSEVLRDAWSFFNQNADLGRYPALLAYGVKVLGSIVIGIVAFSGFRKTP